MLIFLEGLQSSLKRCENPNTQVTQVAQKHFSDRKRLAQEEAKIAEQREKSKEKKAGSKMVVFSEFDVQNSWVC